MGTVESAKKKIDTKQAKHYRKLISKSKDAFLILNSQAKIINANNPSVKLFQAKNKKQLTSITFFVLCVTEQQSFPKLSLDQIKDKIAKQALEFGLIQLTYQEN
ncbi:hypothetical protein M0811_01291 [Anaeramoeba ignava]|uniref:Uncharacterized protein n=1 Tax=Anaeramoeba ignava TaxID=1746090 RepID=A0A9Q0LG84_ANAIG|nr:hypothetical protein M0811_01291 [Anaeramoeba ignava]